MIDFMLLNCLHYRFKAKCEKKLICLYVCFYVYKMVNVYLGVSFSDANEWNTSCQSFDDEISLIESQSMIAWTEH